MSYRSHLTTLTEVALFSALSVLLDRLVLFQMPQGGSVTLVMVPLLLVALRHGAGWGIISGAIVGFLQLLFGGFFLNVFQVLLDYGLAYAGVGLAGIFAQRIRNSKTPNVSTLLTLSLAAFLGGSMRLLGSFLSGVIFYADYAPAGTPVWIYSLTYNLSYTLPSTLIALVLLALLYRARPSFFHFPA